jgi:hypothetical protein
LANEFAEDTTLTICGIEIEKVDTFKYLGRPLSATSNEIPAINHNLRKAKKTWGRIRNLLKREGSDVKTSATFYKTIVQSTLLYGAETWDTPADTLQPIVTFHNYVARHLTNRHIRKIPNTEIWVYPNMVEVLKQASLSTIQEYIFKRKINLAHRIQNRPIFMAARIIEHELFGAMIWLSNFTP